MKKTYILKDLGCASCASKMEHSIGKIKGVKSVNINYMTAKMELEASDEDFEDILIQSAKKIKKIERQVELKEC